MQRLTLKEIEACTRGVQEIEPVDGGCVFTRFPAPVLEHYSQKDGQRIRSRCPTGVVLDMVTDTREIHVSAEIGEGARPPAFFDLLVNGALVDTLGKEDAPTHIAGSLHCYGSEKGPQHVRLYLPHVRIVTLNAVAIDDGASLQPASAQPLWLALGDSITQGMSSAHPALTYVTVAARDAGYSVFNHGVGGAVFELETLPEKPTENPEIITVAYGVNDWNRGLPADNAGPYLERLRALYPDTPITVLEPLTYMKAAEGKDETAANEAGIALERYRESLRDIVASQSNMTLLSRHQLLPYAPDFQRDGCHPSTEGHIVYGRNLATHLTPARSMD